MNDLPAELFYQTYTSPAGKQFPLAMVRERSGFVRAATDFEEALWKRLESVVASLEAAVARRAARQQQPRKARVKTCTPAIPSA